ncbi:MAG: hypothetical protein QM704_27965 [Anaeromyxobacteraceae bacterium]
MDLRKLALVGAIALAACQHGKQTRTVAQAPDNTSSQGTATSGTASGTGSTTGSTSGTAGATGTGDTAGGTASTDAYGQSGTGSGGSASGMAHSDDRVIVGTVKQVSPKSVDIQDAASGQSKTLQIAPETLIEAGGGASGQLVEGQQVRASYNRKDGKDTAVRIEGMNTGATPPHTGGTGTDPSGTGSSGTGSSGTMGEPGTSTGGTGSSGTTGTPDPTLPPGSTNPQSPTQPTPPSPPVQTPPSSGGLAEVAGLSAPGGAA